MRETIETIILSIARKSRTICRVFSTRTVLFSLFHNDVNIFILNKLFFFDCVSSVLNCFTLTTHTHGHTHTHTCARTHTRAHARTLTHTYNIHTQTCTHKTYTHKHTHRHKHTHTRICTHKHTHTQTHTHKYAHRQTDRQTHPASQPDGQTDRHTRTNYCVVYLELFTTLKTNQNTQEVKMNASDSSETMEIITINLGRLTASDMLIHDVIIDRVLHSRSHRS